MPVTQSLLSTKHFFPLPSAGYLVHRSVYFADKSILIQLVLLSMGLRIQVPGVSPGNPQLYRSKRKK
jgi:hypothetical protein